MSSMIIQQIIGGSISVSSALVILFIFRKFDSARVDNVEKMFTKSIAEVVASIKELNSSFMTIIIENKAQEKEIEYSHMRNRELLDRLISLETDLKSLDKAVHKLNKSVLTREQADIIIRMGDK